MMKVVFSIPGLSKRFVFQVPQTIVSPQQKKLLRLKIASHLPLGYLPLHACLLVKNDGGVLLTGPSQAGKSTLAGLLETMGYRTVANDFVAVTWKGEKLWASDINYLSVNKSLRPIEIKYIFALDPNNARDISRMTRPEFDRFYIETLFPLPKKIVLSLIKRPIFDKIYAEHVCLGKRSSPEKWLRSIKFVTSNHTVGRVGIFGLGTIGQDTANLLLHQPGLKELHLYTRDKNKLAAFVLDLKSAHPKLVIIDHTTEEDFFDNCDMVVLCFRLDNPSAISDGVEERVAKILPHSEVVWNISRVIRKTRFSGVLLMVSNPVDILSSALYKFSWLDDNCQKDGWGLFSNQIYGVGLGLDYNRMLAIEPRTKNEVIGPHGNDLQLTKIERGGLVPATDKEFFKLVLDYSERIRAGCARTRMGPVHQIQEIISVFMSDEGVVRASGLCSSGVFLGNIWIVRNFIPKAKYTCSKSLQNILDLISTKQAKLLQLAEKEVLGRML